jgi:hypothetical protein
LITRVAKVFEVKVIALDSEYPQYGF